jgi:DNA-binding NarL/FixJ family response regulator
MRSAVRVLLVDDEELFTEAVAALLGADGRIEVVGRALDGGTAVELAAELQPDVVLMDISMPVLDGFEATRRICERLPDARVLVLTGSAAAADADLARQAGAAGYLTKDQIAEKLTAAVLDLAER